MFGIIHINPTQKHQREHGEWFAAGFKRLGIKYKVSPVIHEEADFHIISGPHYAYQFWKGRNNVLMIDRAYCHPEKSGQWASMDYISLGWLNPDGSRTFYPGEGRTLPELPQSTGTKTIFLADYGGPTEPADIVRLHPDQINNAGRFSYQINAGPTLEADLMQCRKAIGYRTSALITAARMGLEIVCRDSTHILARDNWRKLLPYTDWRYNEIQSGDAWSHICR